LGNILNDSKDFYDVDPAYFLIPGAVLVLAVLAFNMLGDGLRDALDPKSSR
jgi:peptide/nickel transport system permease protein